MAVQHIGDVVATISLGNGRNMYQKVGALFSHDDNDASKGPGFSVVIDKWFNPAGVEGDGPGVWLSVYHPKPKEETPPHKPRRPGPPADVRRPPGTPHDPDFDDDDLPF
jgi:hypothetical protein